MCSCFFPLIIYNITDGQLDSRIWKKQMEPDFSLRITKNQALGNIKKSTEHGNLEIVFCAEQRTQ